MGWTCCCATNNPAALLATALGLVNLVTFAEFRHDKQAAIRGERRIRESTLLKWALIGGTPAAFAARHLLRHKTRKQPFSTYLLLIVMIQLGVGFGLFFG